MASFPTAGRAGNDPRLCPVRTNSIRGSRHSDGIIADARTRALLVELCWLPKTVKYPLRIAVCIAEVYRAGGEVFGECARSQRVIEVAGRDVDVTKLEPWIPVPDAGNYVTIDKLPDGGFQFAGRVAYDDYAIYTAGAPEPFASAALAEAAAIRWAERHGATYVYLVLRS